MTTERIQIPKAFGELLGIKARYKAYFGGRGSAKTRSCATAIILRASREPIRVLCCREIQRSIRESVKFELDGAIVRMGLQHLFQSLQTEIRGINGSHIFFEGLYSNPTSIQSLADLDIAWVDEGQSISQRSLDILYPTLRKYGSEIWITWNPNNAKDPVDKLFRSDAGGMGLDGPLPQPYDQWSVIKEVNWEGNEWFPEVLQAELERDKRRDPARYAHIWMGAYQSISDAQVFRNWRIGTIELPPKSRPFFGCDWGMTIDPTVLVRCYVLENRVLYVDAEVSRVGCSIEDTPRLFDSLDNGMARYWPIRADSSWPHTWIYMQNHGYPKLQPARKGPNSVEEGVEFLKNHDIVVHPNCKRVIDELSLYSYERDKRTEEVLPVLADKDNHTIDALRYAVEELRHAQVAEVAPVIVTAPLDVIGSHPGW